MISAIRNRQTIGVGSLCLLCVSSLPLLAQSQTADKPITGMPLPNSVVHLAAQAKSDSIKLRIDHNVEVPGADGGKIQVDVYRPDDDTIYPIIVMIHGGAWSTGDKGNVRVHAKELARAGFVVIANNYRLAPKHKYPAQLSDCQHVLKWLAAHAEELKADPERYGLWGYSAGGQLAATLACRPAPQLAKPVACVIGGAPCEFSFLAPDSRVLSHVMGGTREQIPEVYKEASPAEWVNKDLCPFFVFHGTADFLVPQTSSQKMLAVLKKHNVEFESYIVNGKGHLLTFMDPTARRKAITFLAEHFHVNDNDRDKPKNLVAERKPS